MYPRAGQPLPSPCCAHQSFPPLPGTCGRPWSPGPQPGWKFSSDGGWGCAGPSAVTTNCRSKQGSSREGAPTPPCSKSTAQPSSGLQALPQVLLGWLFHLHVSARTTGWIAVSFLPQPQSNLLCWPPEAGGGLGCSGDDVQPGKLCPQPWDLRASLAPLCAPWVVPGVSDFCLLVLDQGSLGIGVTWDHPSPCFLPSRNFLLLGTEWDPESTHEKAIPRAPALGSWPGTLLASCVQLLLSRFERHTQCWVSGHSSGCPHHFPAWGVHSHHEPGHRCLLTRKEGVPGATHNFYPGAPARPLRRGARPGAASTRGVRGSGPPATARTSWPVGGSLLYL